MSTRVRVFAVIAIVLIVAVGFVARSALLKPTPVTLSTGMPMASALDAIQSRGFTPGRMGYAGSHRAFDLPDGRTVVLVGDLHVDSIQIIDNARQPKVYRTERSVPAVTF